LEEQVFRFRSIHEVCEPVVQHASKQRTSHSMRFFKCLALSVNRLHAVQDNP
jgi:hypothetical protein